MPKLRRTCPHLVASLVGMLAGLTGCLQVDTSVDQARTHALIRDRVGEVEVFDPDVEPQVVERVTALLEGGLTIDEAVQIALLANRSFQARFADLGAARADVVQSRLLSNPSLAFSSRYPEGGGRPSIMLSVGQELVDLWQIPVRRRIATDKLDAIVFDIARQAVDLAADVKTRCHQVLAWRRTETRVNENVALIERSFSLAEARFRAGETGLLDMNLVKSNLLQAQLELIAVRRDRRVAETELARVLGLARWPTPWTLNEKPTETPVIVATDDGLLLTAMAQRFDANSAAREVAAAEGDLKRQWLNIFPKVMVGIEGERMERRSMPDRNIPASIARESIRAGALSAPEIMSRGERQQQKRQMIDTLLGPSLAITLPIYDQNQAQIAKARFMAEQRRKTYEALLDQIAQEVQAAAAMARTARQLVDFYEQQSLPQANLTLDAAGRSYEAGEQNVLALIEAQGQVIRQQREAIAARRDLAIALAELERAVGGRLPVAGEATSPAGLNSNGMPVPAVVPVGRVIDPTMPPTGDRSVTTPLPPDELIEQPTRP